YVVASSSYTAGIIPPATAPNNRSSKLLCLALTRRYPLRHTGGSCTGYDQYTTLRTLPGKGLSPHPDDADHATTLAKTTGRCHDHCTLVGRVSHAGLLRRPPPANL